MNTNPTIAVQIVEREISALLAAYPALAEDEEFRLDVIEGETDAIELLDGLCAQEREADAQIAGIEKRMDALKSRRDRLRLRKEALRKLMQRIMSAAGLRKVQLPEATLFVRAAPRSVIVTDEGAIPKEYLKVTTTVDKAALLDALKAGTRVPGAMLSNGGEMVSVRT